MFAVLGRPYHVLGIKRGDFVDLGKTLALRSYRLIYGSFHVCGLTRRLRALIHALGGRFI